MDELLSSLLKNTQSTKQKLILTDIDEIVLQCFDAFQTYCEKATGYEPDHQLRDCYHIDKAFSVSRSDANEMLERFFRSEPFGQLSPRKSAAIVLPRLYAQGWKFVAVTACSAEPSIVEARRQNLRQAFGFDWGDVHCTDMASKRNVLSSYSKAVWVEDHYENAVIGAKLGHKTFLLNRVYNAGFQHPDVRRVRDWYDIEREILEQ